MRQPLPPGPPFGYWLYPPRLVLCFLDPKSLIARSHAPGREDWEGRAWSCRVLLVRAPNLEVAGESGFWSPRQIDHSCLLRAWKAGVGASWERSGAPEGSYCKDDIPFSPHLTAPLDFHTCSFSLSDISQLVWMTFLQNLALRRFAPLMALQTGLNDHITLRTPVVSGACSPAPVQTPR